MTTATSVDTAAHISPVIEKNPWRDELRAMLALAWPLILANLAQQAIQGGP